jgi:hypothetical protein
MGDMTRVVNCPGRRFIPIKFCDNCLGCLGMETDDNGNLYVFCSEEDERTIKEEKHATN